MTRKVLALSLALFAAQSQATEVVVQDLPGLHTAKGTGDYDKIIQKVAGTKTSFEGVKRAFQKFDACADCCISPANTNPDFYTYTPDKYIMSKPMNLAKVYIFSPPGKPAVSDLASLKGKTVGARLGLPYGKKVDTSGLKLDLVGEDAQNIKLLQINRIDYMIAYVPDAYDAFKTMGIEPFPHVKDKPIAEHEDAVLCKKTPANKEFIDKLNAAIK